MKKFVWGLGVLLVSFACFGATELNTEAEVLKKEYPEGYQIIKKHALKKWKDNFKMVVYEINKESKAYFELLKEYGKTKDIDVLASALKKWTHEGHKIDLAKMDKMILLEVQWNMVLYEYKKQVKAKNAF